MDKGIADRVLVIGIDGATFDLLDPWIEAGELPNIASLIHNGARGRLSSVLPINSVAGWASFATGMNPGKHGLYDFKVRKEGSYETELVDINMLEKPTLWEILSAYGKRVGVINVPICYPPQEVNGFMISGMLAPNTEVTYTYPPQLAQEIREKVGEYQIGPAWGHFGESRAAPDDVLHDIYQVTDVRGKTALHLMRHHLWDFFMVVFTGSDRIQHYFWGYNDPSHPNYVHQSAAGIRNRYREYFELIDRLVGEIIGVAGTSSRVFIISDHGFGPLYKQFYINKWLHQRGLLTPEGYTNLSKVQRSIHNFILRVDRFNLRRLIFPATARQRLKPRAGIDWSRTQACMASESSAGIFINLEGRDPQGIVHGQEAYHMLCEYLIRELLQVRDPETAEPIFSRVSKATELWWGDKVARLPDLLVEFRDGGYEANESLQFPYLFDRKQARSGGHALKGVFVASGPNMVKGSQIEGHNLMDVAPTILHLFGLPVPKEMDGRVIEEIFEERRKVQLTETVVGERKTRKDQQTYSLEEQKEIEERLRGLGYLG